MQISDTDPITSLVAFGFYAFASLVALRLYSKRRSTTMLFFALMWLMNAAFVLTSAFSSFLKDALLFKVQYTVFLTGAFISLMLFIDYAQKDEIGWKKSSIAFAFTAVVITWIWRPEDIIIMVPIGGGFTNVVIPSELIFLMITDAYTIMATVVLLYWAAISFKASPVIMKKILASVLVICIVTVVFASSLALVDINATIFVPAGNPFMSDDISTLLSTIAELTLLALAVVIAIAVYKEPRIVHFLPYKVYQLIITSKNGNPYYHYKWSEEEIELTMSAGLLSAITSFTKETLKNVKSGGISMIQMDRAVMITRLQYSPVNIALIASKSSKDLQQSLNDFSDAFVKKYYNELYDTDGFPKNITDTGTVFAVKDLNAMIKQFFANIPSYIEQSPGLTDPIGDVLAKEAPEAE